MPIVIKSLPHRVVRIHRATASKNAEATAQNVAAFSNAAWVLAFSNICRANKWGDFNRLVEPGKWGARGEELWFLEVQRRWKRKDSIQKGKTGEGSAQPGETCVCLTATEDVLKGKLKGRRSKGTSPPGEARRTGCPVWTRLNGRVQEGS